MHLYRLLSRRYAATALTGEGALLYGGRWNSPGAAVIYTASTLALAALELIANTGRGTIPPDTAYCEIDIPDDVAIEKLEPASLPVNWRAFPAPTETQELGDGWVRRCNAVALVVPSTIVPIENNVILNPAHVDFSRVIAGPMIDFVIDGRLQA